MKHRFNKNWLVAATTMATLMVLLSPSVVFADGPVWKVLSISDPTHFWLPQNQVDELAVNATSGSYNLLVEYTPVESVFLGNIPTGLFVGAAEGISFNASSTEVQTAFENAVGAGNVTVSGGPGDETGSKPYVIRFSGALAGRRITLVEADNNLKGGVKQGSGLSLTEVTQGKPSGEFVVYATNVGSASTDGSTVTLTDLLPSGLRAVVVRGHDAYTLESPEEPGVLSCSEPPFLTLSCTYSHPVASGDTLVMEVKVEGTSASPPSSEVNQVVVSGGGAAPVIVHEPVTFSPTPASFGIAQGSLFSSVSTLQAGAHPNLTTAFALNTSELNVPASNVKDIHFDLPPGLVSNTVGMPRCTMAKVEKTGSTGCPADTVVGTVLVKYTIRGIEGHPTTSEELFPVFNIEPAPGEPAAFAFNAVQFPVRIDTGVLSNGDYRGRATVANITEAASNISSVITFWGVPADHQGPNENNINESFGVRRFGGVSPASTRVPLLTNSQQCLTPLSGMLEVDAWTAPGAFATEGVSMGTLIGCGLLRFGSSMSMLPDTLEAGAPAGYSLSLRVAQNNEPDGLAPPDVRRVVTTLPMGTVISPSAAWGLVACSNAQFGLHSGVPGGCPRESQVGTVQVKTPALEETLGGQVYLASPECDPCTPQDAQDGRMVRLFLQLVGEGESGVVVKLEGKARINQQTGQISAVFDENPQLPFSELKLTLGGGSRATLANPRVCGPASTSMDLTPWSTPFTPDSTPTGIFEVNRGCFGPQFAPSFVAGMTNIQAGEYGPFTVAFGRQDPDEFLNGVQLQMPQGLLGSLAHVPLCREPQAAEGSCGPESLIGHVQVLTGPGGTPFLVTGGQVFLTESYKGAPFGLSIVVPAKAGPYTLSGTTGKGTVVVRSAINVDPSDAHLTVTSDPLPTNLDGIPLQLKVVNVTIDRPGFTFNPTSCARMAVAGTLSSSEGASAPVSSAFQVTNCQGLGFKPQFRVSTSGRTSKARGASLDAKVIYPAGVKLANIAKVKVDLPKQLPSRLTTLQKACTAATFSSNPASCPVASVVGIARTSTPVLPVQLTGPAYFVSHGGEAFPSLIIVLQGDGVRVDLVGSTFISKAGITSSTFKTVPDVPISSFELYLPEGKYSALAANGNLCASKLVMPTAFTGQNGATLHQSTKISVTGCPKTKTAKKKKKGRRAAAGRARAGRASGHGREGGKRGRSSSWRGGGLVR